MNSFSLQQINRGVRRKTQAQNIEERIQRDILNERVEVEEEEIEDLGELLSELEERAVETEDEIEENETSEIIMWNRKIGRAGGDYRGRF